MPTSDPPKLLPWLGGQLPGNQSLWVPGEVWLQSWNLKELTEGHHQEWSLRLNLTQHGKPHQARTLEGLTDWELFLDSVGGGAWPFLVGGAICLVNSDNERDSSLLNRWRVFIIEISGSELVGTRVGVAARWVPCQQSSNTWSNDEVDFIFVFLLVNSDAGVELYLKFIRLVLIMRSFGLMNFFSILEWPKALKKFWAPW